MTPYQQSIEAAKSWKEAVSAMWKRQRNILYLNIGCTLLAVIGLAILIVIFSKAESVDDVSLGSVVSVLALFGIVAVASIAAYVFMWIFFFDVKKWQAAAPESLQSAIKLLKLGLLITLIGSVASGLLSSIASLNLGMLSDIIGSLADAAAFAGIIIEFIAIIRLRKAAAMPEIAQKGANSIFIGYLVSFISAAVGAILLIIAITAAMISALEVDQTVNEETTEVVENSHIFMSGIGEDIAGEDMEDFSEMESALKASKGAFGLLIFALIISVIGSLVSMYYTYRGWWLIGKSELPVLPEPIDDEVGEEVAYEEVEESEVIENNNESSNY